MVQEKLGQIGLGAVGAHFAAHLLKANGHLVVHDLVDDKVQQLVRQGAVAAASPMALAAQSDIVVLSLPSPEAVESVLLGADGVFDGAGPGALIIDLSTIDPFTCEKLDQAARKRGVSYIDAPVTSGAAVGAGVAGAEAGTMTILVGGDDAAVERARPVLGQLGGEVFHLGPVGSGSVLKLVTNHISGIINLAVAEALSLAAAAGFSAAKVIEVSERSVANSYVLKEIIAPRIARRDFEPGFTVDLMHKDHRLAGELAQRLKVPMLLNQLAVEMYQMMRSQGRGQKDHAEVVNFLAELAGVDIYDPGERQTG